MYDTLNMKIPSIGFGITSWRSPKTLAGTLETYAKVGLSDMFDDSFICLQDASEEDIEIAKHFGIRWGTRPNRGIAESMRHIAQQLKADLVLFLKTIAQ